MRKVAASLAAVALTLVPTACGGDGAEPGASKEATLVLDFQPNAVHAGIYAALAEGFLADEGVDLEVRAPSSSTDSLKLLAAGQADLAIMDVHDFGLAVQEGAEISLVDVLVGRPLAAVIAGDRNEVKRPRDLEGGSVGVTGLPSDDAVLDAVLESDGADPDSVERITIGFDSIAALSAGRVDAATAFWNAEGVTLRELGLPTREFRVDDFGAPRYPELVLVSSQELVRRNRDLVSGVIRGIERGYGFAEREPEQSIDHLTATVDGLEEAQQARQLKTLLKVNAFDEDENPGTFLDWLRWDAEHGILKKRKFSKNREDVFEMNLLGAGQRK